MWWLVTGGTFAIVTALTHLGPVVIFPWLYELRPLDRPGLQARLDALTRRVGTPLTAIQEWRFGLETGRPNAALVGIGSTRQVLLSDALLADYSDDEIEVVLAHELAHHVNHDIWKTMVYETAVVVAAAGVAHLVIGRGSERRLGWPARTTSEGSRFSSSSAGPSSWFWRPSAT